jgi:hypothetical protein
MRGMRETTIRYWRLLADLPAVIARRSLISDFLVRILAELDNAQLGVARPH